jgi:4-hydroxyphenylacetate 3-monooxygenase
VIIPPQGAGPDGDVEQVRLVRETNDGIVVSGVQILGTSSAVSDYLFVSCIRPLGPAEADRALSFVVPLATPGLRLHCRRPYAQGAPSIFDYPLSTRFDETDAVVVFEDVHVPWENVFVCGDPAATRDQFFGTAAHVLGNSQAQIRFVAKLKFIIGLARRLAETNRIDAIPSVQEKLGELASLAATVEASAIAAEATSSINPDKVAVPNPRFVYGTMGLQSELYPRVLQVLRELSGSSLLQVPASFRDMEHEDLRTYAGPRAEEKIKLYKLVWDVVGTEFAGRHAQYEMFYAGAPFVARGYAYRNYGYEEPLSLVDAIGAQWSLDRADGEP